MSNLRFRMVCPRCYGPMVNLGCADESWRMADPPQYVEVWVCHKCKVKKKRIADPETKEGIDFNLDEYEEVK